MAVIIEYPDVMAARQLAVLNLPFPDLVKYSILGVSVALLLLAVAILLWQIFRCCTRTDVTQDTGDYYLASYTTPNFLVAPRTTDAGADHERRSLSTMELEEPSEEKVSGSLRFTLFYEPLPSRLVVTILQAEGLQRRSQAHRPHPFIRLRLMWQENQEAKRLKKGEGVPHALCTMLQEWHTRMVRDSCSPMFGEQFSCDLLRQEDLPGIIVRMEVKDFDEFSRHMVLGEVRVPLRHLNMCYPLELQEHLQTPQKDPVGEVLLSLKFLPTAQRLEVGLLKIRTLQTATNADTALYARIIVQCNQCKLRHQKTTAVRQCQVTVFNQVLMFSLPEFPPQECNVAISVYETDATRKHKHLVGQLTVGKDKRSENHHWTLMMRSVRQPIALWHQLLT
ncbi:Synaptotagmin-1 [Merluccius polli]|uniref:Synaptotagmin-1 n=1 Tax=Merluccius polli TaxID=89951 RepID=A0AA47MXK2_MERPO|nr:Synaptotagmin-1 [Merluccius polli]